MVARLRTWNGVSGDLLCESHLPFAAREERGRLENVRATLGDQRQFGAEHFFRRIVKPLAISRLRGKIKDRSRGNQQSEGL